MKGAGKSETIAVRLEPLLKALAEASAAEEGRSVSSWVERLIRREMDARAPSTPPRKRAQGRAK